MEACKSQPLQTVGSNRFAPSLFRSTLEFGPGMFLIELFLPLKRGDGTSVSQQEIEVIIAGLTDRFGGATAFTQSPAEVCGRKAAASRTAQAV